jgi:hypothetical protein
VLALLLGACASVPNDAPVVEQLDEQTGVTVARLGKPIELYRENYREDGGDRFAFLGPFETNNMGNRVPYLLIGLPENRGTELTPVLLVNGTPVTLEAPAREADVAGLLESPYKIPMPWVETYYYRADASLIAQLGEAQSLRIEVLEESRTGPRTVEYSADVAGDPRLSDFAGR